MNLLFVADPLEVFNIKKDSTFAMMREAARRGHTLFACEARDLMWEPLHVDRINDRELRCCIVSTTFQGPFAGSAIM